MAQLKYQIVIIRNNEVITCISSHKTYDKAMDKVDKMVKENLDSVHFPIRYFNYEYVTNMKFYIAILKRRDENDNEGTYVKNDYGEYVTHITDNEGWVLVRKEPFEFEETFWVYGYNPYKDRKDFMFIYENLVKKYASQKYFFINVYVYKNKVLFEQPDHMDMVICKCQSDAERLYGVLDDYSQKDKLKYIMFSGVRNKNRRGRNSKAEEAIHKIQKLTHWSIVKIKKNTT